MDRLTEGAARLWNQTLPLNYWVASQGYVEQQYVHDTTASCSSDLSGSCIAPVCWKPVRSAAPTPAARTSTPARTRHEPQSQRKTSVVWHTTPHHCHPCIETTTQTFCTFQCNSLWTLSNDGNDCADISLFLRQQQEFFNENATSSQVKGHAQKKKFYSQPAEPVFLRGSVADFARLFAAKHTRKIKNNLVMNVWQWLKELSCFLWWIWISARGSGTGDYICLK